eukprot:TRINITY_DN1268_c0_g2_i1.p1 TRINITY_DN1268_c0_g2~~TRINITY_DN1268_c0_g2_i1.p1  ORF type:complete len:419 (+),score=117.70 TRINITY_DN1268_c0_g2_i1:135-1391(+)
MLNEAQRKYDEGCECLKEGDYETAVTLFAEVLETRVKNFGDMAPECASAYFKYGSALFFMAQQEIDALGTKAEKVEDGENGGDVSGDEEDGAEGDADEPSPLAEVQEEAGDADEDEDNSDLALAWSMLECARLIHEQQPGQSIEKADILVVLADLSLEKEDYDTCFRDYNAALQIMEDLLQPDDRKLAEICFKICLAYQLADKPKEAMEHICRAIAVCEQRLQRLARDNPVESKGKGKAVEVEAEEDTVDVTSGVESGDASDDQVRKEEVEEIKELLVDLREKEEELRDMSKLSVLELLKAKDPEGITQIENSCREAFSALSGAFSAGESEQSVAQVKNLGVVGRGVKRMTPVPVAVSGNGSVATENGSAPASQGPPKRRTLDDLMGGGETAQGFGSSGGEADTDAAKTTDTVNSSGA